MSKELELPSSPEITPKSLDSIDTYIGMWHKFKLNGSTIVRPAQIHPDSPDAVVCPSVALASSAAASLAAASPSSLYLAQLRFGTRSTMK